MTAFESNYQMEGYSPSRFKWKVKFLHDSWSVNNDYVVVACYSHGLAGCGSTFQETETRYGTKRVGL